MNKYMISWYDAKEGKTKEHEFLSLSDEIAKIYYGQYRKNKSITINSFLSKWVYLGQFSNNGWIRVD